MRKKRTINKIIIYGLFLEITIFSYYTLWGPGSLQRNTAQKNGIELEKEIQCLQKKIKSLEQEKIDWEVYPFYKEKIAREQLYLHKDNEIIIVCDE